MSEREPTYLVLDWDEDFSMEAHVDSDGYQRIMAQGYIQKRRADGIYHAPLIPALFFGENGQQLDTWRQYLHAGDHVVLSRDSGNPRVPDYELSWSKVADNHPQRPIPVVQPQPTTVNLEIPWVPVVAVIAVPLGLYLAYKAMK